MSVSTDTKFAIVPEWVIFHPDLSGNAVRLYCVLMRHANGEGLSWYGRKTLAAEMRCSLNTLDRTIDELERVGAVKTEQRIGEAGQQSNNYHVIFSNPLPTSGDAPLTVDGDGPLPTSGDLMIASVNDTQLNEKDSVSHETAVEKLPTPFEVLDQGCQVLGIEARSYGPELPKQLAVVKRMLAAGHAPVDLIGCLGWLWSNEFQRRKGVDWFDVEKSMSRFVSSSAPAPPPNITDIKNPRIKAALTTDLSDITAEYEAKRAGRFALPRQVDLTQLPAPTGRLGPGGGREVPHLLPDSVTGRH